jgi:Tat protein secretion system quality control protein TatD with DNase activity
MYDEQLEKLIEMALLDGVITEKERKVLFKKAQEIRDIAKTIPLDKILVETDSPYLTPTPFR